MPIHEEPSNREKRWKKRIAPGAIAPRFAERYEEAAIIFDNLHSMHDVISDILANPSVARNRKRAEILRAAALFRDDTSYIMTVEGWLAMTRHMGVENMGGPAMGYVAALPTPTVTYGAVMTHDDRTGAMLGCKYGSATGGVAGNPHAMHDAAAAVDSADAKPVAGGAGNPHAGHGVAAAPAAADASLLALHARLLADTAIRRRMLADTAMRRLLAESAGALPVERRAVLERILADTMPASPPAARRRGGRLRSRP